MIFLNLNFLLYCDVQVSFDVLKCLDFLKLYEVLPKVNWKVQKYSALHFDNSLRLFTFMILNISFVFIFRSISERHSKLWSSGATEDSNRIIFWRNAATIQQLKSAENQLKTAENHILKPFYYSTTMKKLWAFASNFLCFFIILIPAIFIWNCV